MLEPNAPHFQMLYSKCIDQINPTFVLDMAGVQITLKHTGTISMHRDLKPVADELLHPPQPDSNRHIVNALTDDCFKEIFKYLNLDKELCALGRSCRRINILVHSEIKRRRLLHGDDILDDHSNSGYLWQNDDYWFNVGQWITSATIEFEEPHTVIEMGLYKDLCKNLTRLTCVITEGSNGWHQCDEYFVESQIHTLKLKVADMHDRYVAQCPLDYPLLNLPGLDRLVLERFDIKNDEATNRLFRLYPNVTCLSLDGVTVLDEADVPLRHLQHVKTLFFRTQTIRDDVAKCIEMCTAAGIVLHHIIIVNDAKLPVVEDTLLDALSECTQLESLQIFDVLSRKANMHIQVDVALEHLEHLDEIDVRTRSWAADLEIEYLCLDEY